MIRRLLLALLLGWCSFSANAAGTVTFTVQSQNVLRFAHGSLLQTQCDALDAASGAVDFIVMQEVMSPGYPCLIANNQKHVNGAYPPNFLYETSGAKGAKSYVEYYGILYRTGGFGRNVIVPAPVFGGVYDSYDYATFARPPYARRFEVRAPNGDSCFVWIGDFHAMFGKTVAGRRNEATAMRAVYQLLTGFATGAVIIVGDWNLEGTDAAFDWTRAPLSVANLQPDVQTSISRQGVNVNWSSRYDHAVYGFPPGVQAGGIGTYYAGNLVTWRNQVSDHAGIRLTFQVTC